MRLVRVVRNVEFTQLFDTFFITAITTILAVRFYLKITGYPQLGNSTLHIAHLLPGSILMLISIMLLLSTLNRAVRGIAALFAGIGFGLVLDELGKFITKNNDYFFHATPGLIYLTFVILYLLVRYIGQRQFTQDDYIANVFDLLKDAAINDLDKREYDHAKDLLAHVKPTHPLYQLAKATLETVKPLPNRQPSLLDKAIDSVKKPLIIISRQSFFRRLIIGIALVYGFGLMLAAGFFLAGANLPESGHVSDILNGDESDWIGGIAALISAIFVLIAINMYMAGRVARAYKFFEQALLVNIFIGQVVLFFKSQGIALIWLTITLFLLLNLKILASENPKHSKDL